MTDVAAVKSAVWAWVRDGNAPVAKKLDTLTTVLVRLGIPKVSAITTDEQAAEIMKMISAPTDYEKVRKAIDTILELGSFDGAHHKQWALDQTLRVLAGVHYPELIAAFCVGEGGSETYEWSEGIAP